MRDILKLAAHGFHGRRHFEGQAAGCIGKLGNHQRPLQVQHGHQPTGLGAYVRGGMISAGQADGNVLARRDRSECYCRFWRPGWRPSRIATSRNKSSWQQFSVGPFQLSLLSGNPGCPIAEADAPHPSHQWKSASSRSRVLTLASIRYKESNFFVRCPDQSIKEPE